MVKEFYSNGKLLLSGEYAVLDGAYAWAIPTKYGQLLKVTEKKSPQLSWRSFDEMGNVWFEARYRLGPITEVSSSNAKISKTLLNLLEQAQNLNSNFLVGPQGYAIETKMDFPRDWGLGTSSTLVNNIANWAAINPYELLKSTFGGSGYDIACAQHKLPILFHLNKGLPISIELIESVSFTSALYFVYLNEKKNSREAISDYSKLTVDKKEFANQISTISRRMIASQTLQDFESLMKWHEKEIAKVLGLEPIQTRLFSDYWGAIKSLGAWGGDFILVTGNENTPDYFKEKGYDTIIPYSQMVFS